MSAARFGAPPEMNELLAAICSALSRLLPELTVCAPRDGRFDAAELRRAAVRAPAIYVACLGAPRVHTAAADAQVYADLQLAIYIVTTNAPGLPRGSAARNLADALLVYIPRARWDTDGIGAAEQLRADNLYSTELDERGAALWSLTWTQRLRLGTAAEADCPPLPSELYASPPGEPAAYEELTQ